MNYIWVAGCNRYETIGVINLLKSTGIIVRAFRSGHRLCAGDTLVICFSSIALLGAWRYLKIIHWVSCRYDIRLVVLCPDEVSQAAILLCGTNIEVVNAAHGNFRLSFLLQQAVQYCQPEAIKNTQVYMWSSFSEKALQILYISPASKSDRSTAQAVYRQRSRMIQRLGFSRLITLQIIMAGFARK